MKKFLRVIVRSVLRNCMLLYLLGLLINRLYGNAIFSEAGYRSILVLLNLWLTLQLITRDNR